jgi:hypothetical protein
MKKKIFLVFLLSSFYYLFCENIEPVAPKVNLLFSIDGGKTYNSEFPVLPEPQEIYVKVSWELPPEVKEIVKDGVVLTILYSEQTDFASANKGYHKKEEGWFTTGWFQRLPKYWFGWNERSCIFILDLRERKEGVMGYENKWDKEQKKYVDAPLPYCPPLKKGTYKFGVRVYYYTKENKSVSTIEEFFVTVGEVKKESKEKKEEKKEVKLSQKISPYFEINQDYVFTPEMMDVIEGEKNILRDGNFIKMKSGQELGWKISNIKEGEYYILLITQTGTKTGEEEILKGLPFIFLNGKGIKFDRCGSLYPYKNIFYSIIQSKQPYFIKNGDEIRINSDKTNIFISNLILRKKKLDNLPLFVREFYDPYLDDYVRISGKFENISFEDKNGIFSFSIKNVKGKKENYKISLKILDYQQRKIIDEGENIELLNRETFQKSYEFKLTDTDRYRAILVCSDREGNKIEKQFEILVDNPLSLRKKIWLNKNWEYFSIIDDGTLKTRKIDINLLKGTENWKKGIELPASWKDNSSEVNNHICWYRKKFFVPEWFKNNRYFIHFSRVSYECEVYLNGEKIGYHFGPMGPFEFEITKYLKLNSENEILIGIRDEISALEDSELLKQNLRVDYSSKLKAPYSGRTGIGEIYLYSTGDYPIEDVFVKTSYREKNIVLEIKLPDIDKENLLLKNYVYFEGKKVLDFPEYRIKKNEKNVKIEQKWENPILWGPEKFPLLTLKTELIDRDGKILDILETRFGFREFWPEGKHLYWNGVKVKLPSVPFLSTWGWNLTQRSKRDYIRNEYMRISKNLGVKMHRHIYDPEYRAEIADEEGIIFAQGTATVAGLTNYVLSSDEFWKNKINFDKEIIKGLKNHPSIVEWYVSNECMGQSYDRNYERLKSVYEELIKIDDTRTIEFGCDIDLRGTTNIFSTHYPVDVYGLRESKAYLPDLAYWRNINETFEKGMKIPCGQIKKVANVIEESPMRYGEKPIIINECCWNVFFYPPDGLTRVVGEEVYTNPVSIEFGHKEANRWFVYGYRDAEVSAITLWEWVYRNPVLLEIPEVDINIIQKYNKFYEGEKVVYDVNLHYDRFEGKALKFKWELKNEKGERIKGETKNLYFNSCDLKREKIKIEIPKLNKKEKFLLKLSLVSDENYPIAEKEFIIYGYPKIGLPIKVNYNVSIYDTENNTYSILTKLIPKIQKLDKISPDTLKNFDILIIGENQKGIPNEIREIILKWVKDGGKVLVLKQEKNLNLSPVPMVISPLITSTPITFRNSHPLFKKINIEELNYWCPDHKVGENFYIKPQTGNYRSIVEAGGPEGLIYTGVIEFPYGKGLLFFSQLNILENIDKNPIPLILLKETLEYLGEYKEEMQTIGLILGKSAELIKELLERGVKFSVITDLENIKNFKAVMIDENYTPKEEDIQKLKEFIKNGGTILFNKITLLNSEYISKILDDDIKVAEVLPENFEGRAIKIIKDEIIEGLTNYDFFWKKRPESEDYGIIFYSKEYNLGKIADYEILSSKGISLFFPSIIVKIDYGKGKAILNNINWEKGYRPHSERIISTILTNLYIEIGLKLKEGIPKNITYKTIDISKFMNRSFKDEKADDGTGGWTDQGADCDLRDFPVDKDIFVSDGVPFRIEKPLSCIVLSSRFRPESNLPEKVEIPFGFRADVIFFLHSSAWTSKAHHASYIINYQDGSNYEIKLIGGINLRDWASSNPEEPFLFETDTISSCAWTGTSKTFPKVSLYKMAWINPFPEKEIRSITFLSKNIGVPILVAITAGIKQEKISLRTNIREEDKKMVLEIVERAKRLLKENKVEEGEKFLIETVEKYPFVPEPYYTLGYFYEEKKDFQKAINIYTKLIGKIPEELEGYLRLGICYEEIGDYMKAYEVYKKSLEINLNQPEILKAIERIKTKIKF